MASRAAYEGLRVLVVEDEGSIREGIAAFLELEFGIKATLAGNGEQALRAVAASPPDLIITDVLMPVLDGIELVRRLKADHSTSHIPIIVVAAWHERRNRALAAGADAYVDKPFDLDDLADRVAQVLAKRSRPAGGHSPASTA